MANSGIIQKQAAAKAELTAKKPIKTLKDYVKSMEGEIAKALPSVITPERFTRMVFTALSSNPKLQECTPQSFLGAMMAAAQMGTEVNTSLGQAYILPYKNHGVMEATYILG
jgi:recombination protein RecT